MKRCIKTLSFVFLTAQLAWAQSPTFTANNLNPDVGDPLSLTISTQCSGSRVGLYDLVGSQYINLGYTDSNGTYNLSGTIAEEHAGLTLRLRADAMCNGFGSSAPLVIAIGPGGQPDYVVCPDFGDGVMTGRRDFKEPSGMVASHIHTDMPLLWGHSDSRNPSEVYGFDPSGEIHTTINITNANNIDWEDMAYWKRSEDEALIYVGDIGTFEDTDNKRDIYIIEEPQTLQNNINVTATKLTYKYDNDDGGDAEAMAVDPLTGDIIVVHKSGDNDVHLIPFADQIPGTTIETQKIGELEQHFHDDAEKVVGMDISADGRFIVVKVYDYRVYDHAYGWLREPGESLQSVFSRPPCYDQRLVTQHQAEAIAIGHDNQGFYVTTEGSHDHGRDEIMYYQRTE